MGTFLQDSLGYKQTSSPSPFSQKGRRGTELDQTPSPLLGEGFRVRASNDVSPISVPFLRGFKGDRRLFNEQSILSKYPLNSVFSAIEL